MDYTKIKLNKILELIPKDKTIKAIDIGCNRGEVTSFLYKQGYDILGVDINSQAIHESAKKYPGVKFVCKDVFNLDFKNYDFIIAWGLFEYIFNLQELLIKFEKEMKKGATLIFSVPNVCSFSKRIRCLFGINPNRDGLHSITFTFKQIRDLISNLDFNKKEIFHFNTDSISNFYFPVPGRFSDSIIVRLIK